MGSRGHRVLAHSFQECERSLGVILACYSHNLVGLVDVVSNKVVLGNFALNVDFFVLTVSNKVNRLVVVSGPEKWNLSVWNKLSKHVKGSVSALI